MTGTVGGTCMTSWWQKLLKSVLDRTQYPREQHDLLQRSNDITEKPEDAFHLNVFAYGKYFRQAIPSTRQMDLSRNAARRIQCAVNERITSVFSWRPLTVQVRLLKITRDWEKYIAQNLSFGKKEIRPQNPPSRVKLLGCQPRSVALRIVKSKDMISEILKPQLWQMERGRFRSQDWLADLCLADGSNCWPRRFHQWLTVIIRFHRGRQ